MAVYPFCCLLIVMVSAVLAAGCTAPSSVPVTMTETTGTPVQTAGPPAATTTPAPEILPAPVTTIATPEPPSSTKEMYYDTVTIPMERKQYELVHFEDIGYPYLYPGEKYIVRITSDHAIFAYVIPTVNVPYLTASGGVPVYDKGTRTYEYGQLTPVMKMEDVFEDGADFTVKNIGKYTLVLDTRLSERDYHYENEMTKVTVRILKAN